MLEQTLSSIKNQTVAADIAIVGPTTDSHLQSLSVQFAARLLPDPGSQAQAVNAGVDQVLDGHEYVNWLGDDDLLTENSLSDTVRALDSEPQAVVAYGSCDYISEEGDLLWTSSAGDLAARILSWGPDLIPQPGMLVRATAWKAVGGLDASLKFAFDLDLLLKLKGQGTFVCTRSTVSCFRWHAESLTVSDRTQSLSESLAVKRRHLSPRARRFAWMWEAPVGAATRLAAKRVSSRAQRASASNTSG